MGSQDVGLLFSGESVQLSSYRLKAVDYMTGFPMDCAFEYGVLYKVSQTFLSRHFVAASGSYGHTEILHIPREGNVEQS